MCLASFVLPLSNLLSFQLFNCLFVVVFFSNFEHHVVDDSNSNSYSNSSGNDNGNGNSKGFI